MTNKNKLLTPVVKWVGGKRQLLDRIKPLVPKDYRIYCEPFLGGGALLFSLQPNKGYVNDINKELINMYKTIKDSPKKLINELKLYKNQEDYYYEVRRLDRDKEKYNELSYVKKAARLIYLNKTCYNGLFRVNNAGEFNVPYGRYKNPNIVNKELIQAMSKYLNDNEITITNKDYKRCIDNLKEGDFVYIDPPYYPISQTSNFTRYTKCGFGEQKQIELKMWCDNLTKKGIRFMLSNSYTEFIKDLYKGYKIEIVAAKRNINSKSNKRGNINEVIIRNYGN